MLAKAGADLAAVRLLAGHEEQDDGIIGFHAQQACEKALKAILASLEEEIPLTHNLGFLLGLVEDAGVEVPGGLDELVWLNPWAVTMRYDQTGSELDRPAAVSMADRVLDWAVTFVADGTR